MTTVSNNPPVIGSGICKDVVTPLCLDKRLPLDTLFMVFEEDYRFFPEGQDPDGCDDYGERVVKMVVDRGFAALSGSESPPPQSSSSSPSRGKSSGKGGKPKPESRFHSTSSRGSSDLKDEVNEGFSSNLSDLVRWATVAHRHKVGNLIWVGWCPAPQKATQLGKGSHLIMLSQEGAIHMAEAFADGEIERGHIDFVLKAWLKSGNTAERVGACYVCPQMGGYYSHASGCDPKNFGEDKGGRPSAWEGKENPASGTRVATDPKQRGKYLIQWRGTASANRVWLNCPNDKELVEAKWKWKSFREPTASEPSGSTQETKQEEEKDEDDQNPEPTAPRSKRSRRAQRQLELRDRYRVWVDDLEEAAVVK